MKKTIKFADYYKYLSPDAKKAIDAELSTSSIEMKDLEIRRVSGGEVKSIDEKANTSQGYASTRAVDFSADLVIPSGINTVIYKNNPIVHYQHQTSQKPIGKTINFEIDEFGLQAEIEYAVGATKEATSIYKLVKGKFLKQMSMGFITLEACYRGDEEYAVINADLMERYPEYNGGADRIIKRCLLLEISVVNIADNQTATIAEVKGLSTDDLTTIKKLGISVEDDKIDRTISVIDMKTIQHEDTAEIKVVSMPEETKDIDRDIEIIAEATRMGILIR